MSSKRSKSTRTPSAKIKRCYDRWLAVVNDPIAAAILTHAHTLAAGTAPSVSSAPRGTEGEQEEIQGLMNLETAADYLNYRPEGLRKLVRQRLVKFSQNGRGPLRFRREWLDEFIDTNVGGTKERLRLASNPRRKATSGEPRHGFDPSLLSNRRAA